MNNSSEKLYMEAMSKLKLYICQYAGHSKCSDQCYHLKPHEYDLNNCKLGKCAYVDFKVKCIPVKETEEPK